MSNWNTHQWEIYNQIMCSSMKKFLLLMVGVIGLYSCSKESQEPRQDTPAGQGEAFSLSFTAEVGETSPRALDGIANGQNISGNFVSFRGRGSVYGWIYVVDKNGIVGSAYKEFTVGNNGRSLSFNGEVASPSTPIDRATAKVSVYIGLNASGEFENKGFQALEHFGSQTDTPLPDGFCILKSENNPLSYVAPAISGKPNQYKTNGRLRFSMAGHIFFLRFQNAYMAYSRKVQKVKGNYVPVGEPLFREPAIVDRLNVYGMHLEKIKVAYSDGKTELAAQTGALSSGFQRDGKGYGYRLSSPVSFSTGMMTQPVRVGAEETVFTFYSPLIAKSFKPGDEDIPFVFGYKISNMNDYGEENGMREDGYHNFATHHASYYKGSLRNGSITVLWLVHKGDIPEGWF